MKIAKVILISIALFVGLFIVFIMGYPFPYYINNYKLSGFVREFEKISLPESVTVQGALLKTFGNLGNCSNGGDYFVARLITTSMSEHELIFFFENKKVTSVDGKREIAVDVMPIIVQKDGSLESKGFISITLTNLIKSTWFNEQKKSKESLYYIISVIDEDYPPTDFRCF